jgi:hypothetical protein
VDVAGENTRALIGSASDRAVVFPIHSGCEFGHQVPKFCANLTMLFTGDCWAINGGYDPEFDGVEILFPYDENAG